MACEKCERLANQLASVTRNLNAQLMPEIKRQKAEAYDQGNNDGRVGRVDNPYRDPDDALDELRRMLTEGGQPPSTE